MTRSLERSGTEDCGASSPPPLFVELARRSCGDVVDVGANTGLYSLLAAAANRSVRVHAVEALPSVAALLRANLELNRPLVRRVRVHQLALSDKNGRAALYLPAPCGSTIETSASLDPTFKEAVVGSVEVEACTLDGLCGGQSANLTSGW